MADVVPEEFVRRLLQTLTPWDCGSCLVRIGPDGDGGYLVPDAHLGAVELVMSAGLGGSSAFEDMMFERFGVPASIVDGSMDRPSWLRPEHRFHRRWLAGRSTDDRWTLDEWVSADAPDSGELLLQMDVEGAEYRALEAAQPSALGRFRVIVVELHGLGRLTDRAGYSRIAPALANLARQFVTVHAHPNNYGRTIRHGDLVIPDLLEITCVRRDSLGPQWQPEVPAPLPHHLDRRSAAERDEVGLWTGWPATADSS
jgi:hypothetical protein